MKLTDLDLTEFSRVLASEAPAPGGGSTAALEGALGAALAHMVAALTTGKKKYAEHEPLLREIMAETAETRAELLAVIDRDTEAFNQVSAVFSMSRETEEDKKIRALALEEALKACTLTPFEMMRLSLKSLEAAEKLLGRFNTSAASDLGVAALSLKAALQGAWLNILINIGGLKDRNFADRYRAEGEKILSRALPLADHIYGTILESLA